MKSIVYIILATILMSCGASHKDSENERFTLDNLQQFLDSETLVFQFDAALPQTSQALNSLSNSNLLGVGNTPGRINLIGNSHTFIYKNDSVVSDLPYYGERQMPSINNTEIGIKHNGEIKDLSFKMNTKRNNIVARFEIPAERETYNVILTLFTNGNSNLSINSTHRSPIQYTGQFEVEK